MISVIHFCGVGVIDNMHDGDGDLRIIVFNVCKLMQKMRVNQFGNYYYPIIYKTLNIV